MIHSDPMAAFLCHKEVDLANSVMDSMLLHFFSMPMADFCKHWRTRGCEQCSFTLRGGVFFDVVVSTIPTDAADSRVKGRKFLSSVFFRISLH